MKLFLPSTVFVLLELLIYALCTSGPNASIIRHGRSLHESESKGLANDPHSLPARDRADIIPITEQSVSFGSIQKNLSPVGSGDLAQAPFASQQDKQSTQEASSHRPYPLDSEAPPPASVVPFVVGEPFKTNPPFSPQTSAVELIQKDVGQSIESSRGLQPRSPKVNRGSFPPSNPVTKIFTHKPRSLRYAPQFKEHPSMGFCKLSDFTYDESADFIDEGASSQVYSAKHKNGKQYALKKILGAHVRDNSQQVGWEEQTLHSISHPNVIEFYCSMQDPRTEDVFFVMEMVVGDNLANLVDAGLPEEQRLSIVAQILKGMYAIHKAGIIHGDVKAQNVMVREADGMVKIIDFGLAMFEHTSPNLYGEGLSGTPGYIAPEVLQYGPLSRAADLYAVGIILLEIYDLALFPPPSEEEDEESYANRLFSIQANPPTTNDSSADEVVSILCDWDPQQRWENAHKNFGTLKTLPYFKGYQWGESTDSNEV